jgi:hypothetical protein
MLVTRQSIHLRVILRPNLASVGKIKNTHAVFMLFLVPAHYLGNLYTIQNKMALLEEKV